MHDVRQVTALMCIRQHRTYTLEGIWTHDLLEADSFLDLRTFTLSKTKNCAKCTEPTHSNLEQNWNVLMLYFVQKYLQPYFIQFSSRA
jgi:hypothetical protein